MTYSDAEKYLFGRRRMGMKFGLDRARKLLRDAGDPQKYFRTVHVVGTNGKGSTTALLSEIFQHLGYRVGRTTSPHLLDYRERIAVDNRWITREAVTEFVEQYGSRIEKYGATFFEITTVMSAWYFRKCEVDLAVAEAGLGGRLDATRLLNGECTIFTGVEIEHSRILGSTETAITAEKVAIAKEGSHLIAYCQQPEVEEVISLAVSGGQLTRMIPEPADRSPLPGEHQKLNAGLALAAASLISGAGNDSVRSAFERSCSSLSWPGRLDLQVGTPSVLFDVAHSPGSMKHLIEFVRGKWTAPLPAVVGFLEDKPWIEMTKQLSRILNPVVATTPINERCLKASVLADEFLDNGVEALWRDDISQALELARTFTGDLLVVTGSFFFVGDAMKHAWRRGWIDMPEKWQEQNQLFHDAEVDS